MSEAKKYDRSYMEQSVKPVLEIGLKRAGEGLKIAYGTLYGWVQAAKNGIYTDTTKTKKSQRTQKYPQYVIDMVERLVQDDIRMQEELEAKKQKEQKRWVIT